MTLRARLLLGTGLIALVLVLSAVVVTRSTRAHLTDQVDAQLLDAGPQLRRAGPGAPEGPTPRLSNLYVGVIDRLGQLTTVHTPDLSGDTAPVPVVDAGDIARLRAGEAVTVPSAGSSTRYRLLAREAGPRGNAAVVGLALDDVQSAVRRLVGVEAVAVTTILAALGLVTWWVLRLGVRPIQQMTTVAGAIAAGDLSHRVPAGTPGTEAGALGVALNGMLERIEEAFDQRAASEDRLRQFVADASHELRTPVTTIRGYAELYRNGGLPAGEPLAEAMRRTEQEAIRMGSLVEDLLRLARLDQGRPLAHEPVDLSVIAADAVRDASAVAPDRHVTAATDGPVVVQGDEDGLRQVVTNLLGNALVHAPDASVTVAVRADGDRAVVEVTDDGPGMTEADATRAFERFYRADTSRGRHRGGSGLGLSIVEATARAHGGTVALRSAVGSGTTVRVELPLTPPSS
jgi:two-component system OmpR family sensor kinase